MLGVEGSSNPVLVCSDLLKFGHLMLSRISDLVLGILYPLLPALAHNSDLTQKDQNFNTSLKNIYLL